MINHDSPRLILFDIDGTLLLTGGAGRVATRRAMEEIFGTSSRLDQHKFSGKTDWHTLVELLEDFGYDESRIGEIMDRYQVAAARHTAEVALVQRRERATACERRGADEHVMRSDQRTLADEPCPQFCVPSGLDESERIDRDAIEQRFDEGKPSRARPGVGGAMAAVQQLGRRQRGDSHGFAGHRSEERTERQRAALSGDQN